jgi:hypothetical protein
MAESRQQNELQCRTCKHFLTISIPNEASEFFCSSEDTKVGPNPIGWLRRDAPACRFYENQKEVDNVPGPVIRKESKEADRTVVYFIEPAPLRPKRSTHAMIIDIAALTVLVLSLAGWIASEASATVSKIAPVWTVLSTHRFADKPILVVHPIPSVTVSNDSPGVKPQESSDPATAGHSRVD